MAAKKRPKVKTKKKPVKKQSKRTKASKKLPPIKLIKLKSKPKPKLKPKKQLPKPKPLQKPKTQKPKAKRKKKRQTIGYIYVGDSEDYHTATHLSTDAQKEHYKNFSHLTRSPLKLTPDAQGSTLVDILDIAVQGHLRKMGLEYDDLRVFSYGVMFRPDGEEITPSLVSEIAIILNRYHPQIIIAEEDKTGQNAILINFGRDNKMIDMEHVRYKFEKLADELQLIWELLHDELGCDIDWDIWWDTDEVMY